MELLGDVLKLCHRWIGRLRCPYRDLSLHRSGDLARLRDLALATRLARLSFGKARLGLSDHPDLAIGSQTRRGSKWLRVI